MPQWNFDADSLDWTKASWANGEPFNVGWRTNQIAFSGGKLKITLNNQPFNRGGGLLPFSSGEYRTNQSFKYGLYEVRMKPVRASGTVSSFFTYTGPSDGNPHDEIDVEFLGGNTRRVQFNYFTDGVGAGRNEYLYDLGFDAADAFHTYGFRWLPGSIGWFVDGVEIYRDTGERTGVPLPSHAGKMMMNLWTGDASTTFWQGDFSYVTPLVAEYDWVRYTPTTPSTRVS